MKRENLLFDKHVPPKLKKTQEWFAGILRMPIDEDSRMNRVSPSGGDMEEEAFEYIIPSPTLRPAQRIELYNQQYWWRLLSVMHDAAPLLVRLFGYHDFNHVIGKPYLTKYSPNTWSLNILGDCLPQWVQEEYHANDKQLVLDAAYVDTALNMAFFATHYPKIEISASPDEKELEKISSKSMRLQPHVYLFDLRYDLFSFRSEMMKEEPEYWLEHDFPSLPQDRRHYFILYRNTSNHINWEEISLSAFRVLSLFKEGCTINDVCEWLEEQEEALYNEAASQLHLWFQEWTYRQWLYIV